MMSFSRSFSASVVVGACAVAALPSAPRSLVSPTSLATHYAPGAWARHRSEAALSPRWIRLRGGCEEPAAAEDQIEEEIAPVGFAAQLYAALKDNKSLDPNDHPSSFQWVLAVLLAAYIAVGAPLKEYVPGLRELAIVEEKEVPLTQAQIDRTEREALRKEMEEEYEQTLMQDKITMSDRKAKQDKIDSEQRALEEAENAKNSALSDYTEHIEAVKGRIAAEPADGVLLRLRCPDGHQLTRKFAKDSPVSFLYDYIDLERYKKAAKAPDADDRMLELSNLNYNLVCTMPRLTLSDKTATLEKAGITSSCALMVSSVQPVAKPSPI